MEHTDQLVREDIPARPYFAVNPDLLDDPQHYSYRDLQRLCKQLGLPSSGKREELVSRLQQSSPTNSSPTTVRPANLNLFCVDVGSSPDRNSTSPSTPPRRPATERKPRKKVSPRFTSPHFSRSKRRPDGTPVGILSPAHARRSKNSARKLQFSFLNRVKIIPDRSSERKFESGDLSHLTWRLRALGHFNDEGESDEEDALDSLPPAQRAVILHRRRLREEAIARKLAQFAAERARPSNVTVRGQEAPEDFDELAEAEAEAEAAIEAKMEVAAAQRKRVPLSEAPRHGENVNEENDDGEVFFNEQCDEADGGGGGVGGAVDELRCEEHAEIRALRLAFDGVALDDAAAAGNGGGKENSAAAPAASGPAAEKAPEAAPAGDARRSRRRKAASSS